MPPGYDAELGSPGPWPQPSLDASGSPLEESDASLCDLLAPLVAERVQDVGRLAPPSALEVDSAYAAISAVALPAPATAVSAGGAALGVAVLDAAPGSHFVSACRNLALSGFRRCSLVVDKLGVSIRCLRSDPDLPSEAEQVDFPWSSISDVQDPGLRAGLQGCTVTLGIREPSRLFEGPSGALALVVRLPDRKTARRLADATLAFKAYEAQTALWNMWGPRQEICGNTRLFDEGFAALLLDEQGCAFWSLAGEEEAAQCGRADPTTCGPTVEAYVPQGPQQCCHLCWC